jgi:hypothetical protein
VEVAAAVVVEPPPVDLALPPRRPRRRRRKKRRRSRTMTWDSVCSTKLWSKDAKLQIRGSKACAFWVSLALDWKEEALHFEHSPLSLSVR